MFYMHGTGWGWGWWVLMSIGMIAFWALIIYGIVWLVRGGPTAPSGRTPEPPEEILKRRLALGEISLDEYERLHAAIRDATRRPVAAHGGQSAA
jgi:putative membrane protein